MHAVTHIRARTASIATQRERIQALVARFPDRHIHVLDAMYRLTAPSPGDPARVRVWENSAGDLVGFAKWQPAFKMFDYGFDPRAGARLMADAILDWGVEWFTRRAKDSRAETCWIKVLAQNREWVEAIEEHGFSRCGWSIAHMESTLDRAIEPLELPEGFGVRVVAGEQEAGAWADLHRAVFPRVGMSKEWRLEIMRASTYRPDLDLVAVAPDGALAAFCQGWVGSTESGVVVGEIEPMGTHPAYRHQRLGRSLLLALMRQMQAVHVRRVFSEPWDDNAGALHRYRSVGFAATFAIPAYARAFA